MLFHRSAISSRVRRLTHARRVGLAALLVLTAVALPRSASGQTPTDRAACSDSEEARQLDFWIGAWDVLHPETGDTLGRNVIEPDLDRCVLLERWTGAGGSSGMSMNFYDPQRKTWRQVWVSDRGNILDYRHGELRDSAMHFTGVTLDPAGDTTFQKLIFMPVSPDTVRQVFQASTDRGSSWETTWVGIYIRRPAIETP